MSGNNPYSPRLCWSTLQKTKTPLRQTPLTQRDAMNIIQLHRVCLFDDRQHDNLMHSFARANLVGVFLIAASMIRSAVIAAGPTAEQVEFFEKRIRPIFAEHCYSCHSDKAEKVKGGLRLDTREALRKGGSSGAAIVPGDPDASPLIKAVRYQDEELRMPPPKGGGKKLSDDQIAALEAWVKLGAPDPRITGGPRPLTDISEARARHWAFQPVRKPAPPEVKQNRWGQTPV